MTEATFRYVSEVTVAHFFAVPPVEGYPYVGLVALTFLTEPTVDFSITPDNILGGAVSVAWQHWILPVCCMQFFCYVYRTSSLHPSISVFTKALPLLREALTAGLVSSLPNLGDDDYQERTTLH